jgi:glycosyltransferase involved in cell wall biosynthesis
MLSVVIPNFNHAQYLPAALAGLLAQTRPADEIIVIDDASTDDSVAVISAYLDRHPNLALLRNSRNLGVVPTLNRGLAEARGSIVYCGAADDVTYPGLFARGVALLEAHPQAALFSARSDRIDAEGHKLSVMRAPVPLGQPGFLAPATVARLLMRDDAWFIGNTTLYRREPLVRLGGFPEDLGSMTDGYVSRLLALRDGACFSPEILAAWRRLEGGLAWSQGANRAAMEAVIAATMHRMAQDGAVFPPHYAERWRARFIYGNRRFELNEAKRRAQGFTARLAATTREFVLAPSLFLRLRPWDAGAVAQRLLRDLFTAERAKPQDPQPG